MEKFTKRQNQIIEAAMKLIGDGGIQELTMNNIGEEIGVTEPAIYRHFDSKLDILLGIMDKFENNMNKLFDKLQTSEKSNVEKIKEFYKFHLKNFMEKPYMAAVLFSEDIFRDDKSLSERVYKIMQKNQKNILDIIKDAEKKGEIKGNIPPEQMVLLIMGPLRLLVKKWKLSGHSFNLVKRGDILCNNLLKAIGE
ncbi:MAG: TetR/AcrR family transcriptional regulator [Elusimicrobiota bacterium]